MDDRRRDGRSRSRRDGLRAARADPRVRTTAASTPRVSRGRLPPCSARFLPRDRRGSRRHRRRSAGSGCAGRADAPPRPCSRAERRVSPTAGPTSARPALRRPTRPARERGGVPHRASSQNPLDAHFRATPHDAKSPRFCWRFDSGGGIRARDLRVMRSSRGSGRCGLAAVF